MRRLVLIALLPLAACSFTTASGFNECDQTSDCASGRVCSQHFCVAVDCKESYGATDAGDAIVLGAAIPFTTPGGTEDQSERADFNAAVLALDEVNQRGIGGRKLALYACDTANDPTRLSSELDYLIQQKKVNAVLTSGSTETIAAVKQTLPAGVMVIAATSTSPEIAATPAEAPLPDGGTVRMIWRTAPSDSIQGQVIASAILTGGANYADGGDPYLANVNKVGILYVDDPYGQGLSEVVATALGTQKTVDREQYPRGGDATAAVNALNAFAPDLTIAIGFPDDLVKILNQADTLTNLKPASGNRWFFSDAAKDPALLSGLNDATQLENALGSDPAQGAGPAYQSFASRYQTRFGVDPTSYSFTGHTYDAMYLLALGSAYAVGPAPAYSGTVTGAQIAEGLTRVSSGTLYQLVPSDFTAASSALESGNTIDVDGASGHLDFNPATGEAPGPIEIWRVHSGGFQTVNTVEPALRSAPPRPYR